MQDVRDGGGGWVTSCDSVDAGSSRRNWRYLRRIYLAYLL